MDSIRGLQILICVIIGCNVCCGLPARGCPRYYRFYVQDHANRCKYYECLGGSLVGGQRSCPSGMGTRPWVSLLYSSDNPPCNMKVTSCIRHPNFAGVGSHSGGRVTHPPPTKVGFTYTPPTTAPPQTSTDSGEEATTVSQTTELIGMTTDEDMEITTGTDVEMTTQADDLTTDVGSGEDEDPKPGKVGMFVDKAGTSKSLPITVTTQNECMKQCYDILGWCWGLDWSEETKECNLYLKLSDTEQCGGFEGKPKNVHFRIQC